MPRVHRKKWGKLDLVGRTIGERAVQVCPLDFASVDRKGDGCKKKDDYAEKDNVGRRKNQGGMLKLTFQVAQVKKPLLAVHRIAEKGNYVKFGPGVGDSYIEHGETGSKIVET